MVSMTPRSDRKSRRLSIGLEALLEDFENDDAERRERRRSQILETQQATLYSPKTPAARRRSNVTPVDGLSNVQMSDHYRKCIQLNSENKINIKNAFDLHLIDCMATMLHKDGETTNFQMAGSSLDTSAKIYGYRVDSVHADTYKIASGIIGNKKNSKIAENEDMDDDDDGKGVKKTKKSKRRKKTIVQDLSEITMSEVEQQALIDPMLRKIRTSFDEHGLNGLLLNMLHCQDDSLRINLHSGEPAFPPITSHQTPMSMDVVITEKIKDTLKTVIEMKPSICPELENFSFLNFTLQGNCPTISSLPPVERHISSLDAIPEMEEEMEDDLDDDPPMLDEMDGPLEASESPESSTTDKRLMSLTEMIQGLSLEPTEYSYFDPKFISAWAGPDHWHVKPQPKAGKNVTMTKKGNMGQSRKKEKVVIDFNDDDDNLDYQAAFAKSTLSLCLSSKVLQGWKKANNLFPSDLHYDPTGIHQLFLKPKLMIKRKQPVVEMDDAINDYDYDNANDCNNFCPAPEENSHSTAIDTTVGIGDASLDLFGDTIMDASRLQCNLTILDNTLVPRPLRFARLNVPYARTAKKVNVKKLKAKMWDIVTTDTTHSSFCNMFTKLQVTVTENIAQDLTMPMAFVCLLYLVNEKELVLEADKAEGFLIRQAQTVE